MDHGKTTLLDFIRKTSVTAKEPGLITQTISTTFIPTTVVTGTCEKLLERFKFSISVPGLLFIDTPGHAAFTTMRQRGGSIADIAVVVVDINEGLMPQTTESIEMLKSFKTPFVIAMNKIDRIYDWSSGKCFIENFSEQYEHVKGEFEKKFYSIVKQITELGLDAERFDRIADFSKKIAIVPISAKTGEGVPDLLTVIAGLSEKFLKNRLITTQEAGGTILEVKEVTGLGTTIDVIVYDGTISKGDFLIIGGKSPVATKIKALLEPQAMKDMRTEKQFVSIDSCSAAIGVKIVATGLKDIVAGLPVRTAKSQHDAESIMKEMKDEASEVEIERKAEGLILRADTVGSLEALIRVFEKYAIRSAKIGNINKNDVINAEANNNPMLKIVIGFNAGISDEAEAIANASKIKIFTSDIIYRLVEDYEKYCENKAEEMRREELRNVTKPGKIKILPGCVFRTSSPAIVGCEVVSGKILPKSPLFKVVNNAPVVVGTIKQIQKEGNDMDEAKIGDKVAVSITGPTVGRQIRESDELYTNIEAEEYKKLKKFEDLLTQNERQTLDEIAGIKKRKNPSWGL
ncbi:MAG: translation initiation factor IF-2 [Candidatus Aenigmarchaeota archaeon]|nr:translation initiation factor IF-2 [Candidatus Aenigmarchaeota archaeon]